MGNFTVLVCGGRGFDDLGLLDETLTQIWSKHGKSMRIIEGGGNGADFLAKAWAKWYEIDHEQFPADWKKHGKAAGPIRNQQMLDEGTPDLVVAFPGGWGTKDMVSRAKKAEVEVMEVTPIGED